MIFQFSPYSDEGPLLFVYKYVVFILFFFVLFDVYVSVCTCVCVCACARLTNHRIVIIKWKRNTKIIIIIIKTILESSDR